MTATVHYNWIAIPTKAAKPAAKSPICASTDTAPPVLPDDVGLGELPEPVLEGVEELEEPEGCEGWEGEGCVVPELFVALSLKLAAVWSPDKAGFTERTIPDLQSEAADEKNQRGFVSLTCRLWFSMSLTPILGDTYE